MPRPASRTCLPTIAISITNAPGADAYPISSFTYLLIPAQPINRGQRKDAEGHAELDGQFRRRRSLVSFLRAAASSLAQKVLKTIYALAVEIGQDEVTRRVRRHLPDPFRLCGLQRQVRKGTVLTLLDQRRTGMLKAVRITGGVRPGVYARAFDCRGTFRRQMADDAHLPGQRQHRGLHLEDSRRQFRTAISRQSAERPGNPATC